MKSNTKKQGLLITTVLASVTLWSCGVKDRLDRTLSNESQKDRRQDSDVVDQKASPPLSCGDGAPNAPCDALRDFGTGHALAAFKNCNETDQWIKDRLIQRLEKTAKQRLEQWACSRHQADAKDRPTFCNQKNFPDSRGPMVSASDSESSESSPEASSLPTSTTGTNTQVAGVDEADLVKTQGDRIYQLSGNRLNIMQGWPANQAKFLGSAKIDGTALEMYVSDSNKIIVISSRGYLENKTPNVEPTVIVTTVDTTDAKNPTVQSQRFFSGTYQTSRMMAGDLRLVVSDRFRYLESLLEQIILVGLPSSGDPGVQAAMEKVISALVEVSKKNIQSKSIKDWLQTEKSDGQGPQIGQCEKVFGPTYETDLGVTRIITLNKSSENPTESVLLATTHGLYASQKSLYLSTNSFDKESRQQTVLHKFSWESSGASLYLGSGRVDGSLLNQFAMDEYQGNLRVAATSWEPATGRSVSKISVLGQGKGVLETLGATPNLAEGERIYSVRFAGPRGFLVTFRQVDPLFTLDLKDPAQPKVVGELKIPGFSSYIHMMDDNTLLTIGRGGVGNSTQQSKLSVFDVGDLAQPKEVKTFLIDNKGWGSSEAETNHKAFTYHDKLGILAVPMTRHKTDKTSSGWSSVREDSILVFDVKNQPNIISLGSIILGTATSGPGAANQHWSAKISLRSLFMDDYIYGVSNREMKVRKLGVLDQDVAVVAIPQ